MDILKTLETRLLNYHQAFDEEDLTSVRGEFDVYVAMKAGMAVSSQVIILDQSSAGMSWEVF